MGCFTADDDKQVQLGHLREVSHWCLHRINLLSLSLCCKMNVNPLKLQSLCCIISRTVGAILSKRLSGALVRQKEVPFPKARNQEGTQITLQVCHLKSVCWNACPWRYAGSIISSQPF